MRLFKNYLISFLLLLICVNCNRLHEKGVLVIDKLPRKINIQEFKDNGYTVIEKYNHYMLEGYEIRKENATLKFKDFKFRSDVYSFVGEDRILDTIILATDSNTVDMFRHRFASPLWYKVWENSKLYINDKLRIRFQINASRDTLMITRY